MAHRADPGACAVRGRRPPAAGGQRPRLLDRARHHERAGCPACTVGLGDERRLRVARPRGAVGRTPPTSATPRFPSGRARHFRGRARRRGLLPPGARRRRYPRRRPRGRDPLAAVGAGRLLVLRLRGGGRRCGSRAPCPGRGFSGGRAGRLLAHLRRARAGRCLAAGDDGRRPELARAAVPGHRPRRGERARGRDG